MLLLAPVAALVMGSLISSSRIEQCVQTGAEPDKITCEANKFVVALSVENGQNGTETVEATFSQASDDSGVRKLQIPWRIVLRKSRVMIRYPITYTRSFNSQPSEEIIILSSLNCVDGSSASSPTCGWAVSNGVRIEDSQGFCCTCDFLQTIGMSDDTTRATSLSCDLFSSQQSAHCLRFNNLWYSAYSVGPAETFFTLELGITSYVDNEDGTETIKHDEVLEIGPTSPGARSADGKIIARLLGDFAPWAETPNLEYKYLTVPSSPANHARVLAGSAEWMLLDRSLFTTDGSECNKIGVSYSAFRHDSNACRKKAGSCLGGQLESFRAADAMRIAAGGKPQNMVSAYGNFSHVYAASSGNHYIAYAWPGMQASVITLEMAADNVRFITNNAPGEIDMAEVRDFEALSSEGLLVVRFTNVGTITSDFTVTVDCSQGAPDVKPVAAQRRSVRPYFSETVEFALHSESPLAADMSCAVRLFDSLNAVTDEVNVEFSTTALVTDRGAQAGEVIGRGPVTESTEVAPSAGAGAGELFGSGGALCDSQCQGFFDVKCFLLLRCWGRIGRMLAVIAGVAVGSLLLIKACLSPKVRGCVSRLVCGSGRGREGRRGSLMMEDDVQHPQTHRFKEHHSNNTLRKVTARAPPPPPPSAHKNGTTTWETAKFSPRRRPILEPNSDCHDELVIIHEADSARSHFSVTDFGADKLVEHSEQTPFAAPPVAAGQAQMAWRAKCYASFCYASNQHISTDVRSALHSPGDRFSLRGRLVRAASGSDGAQPDGKIFTFHLDDDDTVQHMHFHLGRYVRLVPPMPIRTTKLLRLSPAQASVLTSAAPLFVCLNAAPPAPPGEDDELRV